jgi:hypothetical protein
MHVLPLSYESNVGLDSSAELLHPLPEMQLRTIAVKFTRNIPSKWPLSWQLVSVIIIIIPCKPYLSASATAPHPLGRRKVERLFSLFSV